MTGQIGLKRHAVARMLTQMEHGVPLSARELAVAAHIAFTTLSGGGYLRAMKAAGMIYVAGWRKTNSGFSTPLYAAGQQPNCPRPILTNKTRLSAGLMRIIKALEQHGRMDYREIAEAACLSPVTIKNARYMDVLVTQKLVHICEWRRAKNGPMSAVYEAGKGINVERPQPYSKTESARRHRFKQSVLNPRSDLRQRWTQLTHKEEACENKAA